MKFLACCPSCNSSICELLELIDGKLVKTRKNGLKAKVLYEKVKPGLKEEKGYKIPPGTNQPGFYYWNFENGYQREKTLDGYYTKRKVKTELIDLTENEELKQIYKLNILIN
jgi:hypothetical protein